MTRCFVQAWVLPAVSLMGLGQASSQIEETSSRDAPPALRVAVDEVVLDLHAADTDGRPIADLELNQLRIRDDGRAPSRVLAFEHLGDAPIRVGVLVDTSVSMQGGLRASRAAAERVAGRLIHRPRDAAFVLNFERLPRVVQPWTSDRRQVLEQLRAVTLDARSGLPGTAIFDAIYRACAHEFDGVDPERRLNVILLFSDGEDNASSLEMKDAVGACERNNVAIYAFRPHTGGKSDTLGTGTLAELAAETGGRVLHTDDAEVETEAELRALDADLRDHYRLVYRPSAEYAHDGRFHSVAVEVPERPVRLSVRSGYYAPSR